MQSRSKDLENIKTIFFSDVNYIFLLLLHVRFQANNLRTYMTGFFCLKEAEGLGPQAGQHVPWDLGEAEARKGPGEEVEEEQGKDKEFRFSVSQLLVLTLPVTFMLLNNSSE